MVALAACSMSWEPPRILEPIAITPTAPTDAEPDIVFERHGVSVPRRDGSAAQGWLVLPKGSTPEAAVVVVSGSGQTTRADALPLGESFASNGIAAIVVDKREKGYSFVHRDFDALADDAVGVGDFLAQHEATSGARLAIVGVSEGGWIAPRAAAAKPELFSGVVLVSAPIVSPLAQASWMIDRAVAELPNPIRRVAATAVAAGRPFLNYADEDSDDALASLNVPVFAVWGAEDSVAPVASAHSRLTALVDEPVTTMLIPESGHTPASSTWVPHTSRWLHELPASAQDVTCGVQPSDRYAAPQPPAARWYLDARVHMALAVSATTLFLLTRINRKVRQP